MNDETSSKISNNLNILISLVTGVFGLVLSKYLLIGLLFQVLSCITLTIVLRNNYGKKGCIFGIIISTILLFLSVKDNFFNYQTLGTLHLSCEEILAQYYDADESYDVSQPLIIQATDCEEITLKNLNTDIAIADYTLQKDTIIFNDVPVGKYEIQVKLKGHGMYRDTIELNEKDLKENVWKKDFSLYKDIEYKTFNAYVFDQDTIPLADNNCTFYLNGNQILKTMYPNEKGLLPYTFRVPIDSKIEFMLSYDDQEYTESFDVVSINEKLDIYYDIITKEQLFPSKQETSDNSVSSINKGIEDSNSKKEKITFTEQHMPNDIVNTVSVNTEKNLIGNNNIKYASCFKVTMSNMFSGYGSMVKNAITSRINIQIPNPSGIFKGSIVLEQSMFESNSTGTISILKGDKVVFTTNEIDGNNMNTFPFSIEYSEGDSLIILTETQLQNGDFVYGIILEE